MAVETHNIVFVVLARVCVYEQHGKLDLAYKLVNLKIISKAPDQIYFMSQVFSGTQLLL